MRAARLLPARKRTRSRKKGTGGRERKKMKNGRKRRQGEHSLFFLRRRSFLSCLFSAPPNLPLLAFPMTRSHAAASAALLACSVLLCTASSAQVRERERGLFVIASSSFLLILQCSSAQKSPTQSWFFLRVARPTQDINFLFSWSISVKPRWAVE